MQGHVAMTHRVGWDDLRFVLAVADNGSVAAAARKLGVNHTTVLRRVQAFEAVQKLRLFDRLPTGYVLTAEGEQLVVAARTIDDTVATLERRIAGQDLKLEGTIRVTTTDSLMATVVPRHLASFRSQHPRISIEMAMTNARLNLTKRDADVAIRPAKKQPDALVGLRVADFGFAVYGAASYLDACPTDDLRDHAWLTGDELLANSPATQWMRQHVPDVSIVFRADSYVALCQAACVGLGLATLPCCLGDTSPLLRRVHGPVPELTIGLWLLTHQDLRSAARIRAFIDHLAEGLQAENAHLAGCSPTR
jgi:DNA-binding transcriptional LysR family regulator